MNKIEVALRSPAFWTLVGLFVYHGLAAIAPSFGGTFGTLVQSVLAVMALILHPQEVQVAGMTGKLGGVSIVK